MTGEKPTYHPQLNVVVEQDIFVIWEKIIKDERRFNISKGELVGNMINFYEQNPPSQSSKDSLREDRAQILAKLKEVSAERTRLQIALKTINAELFLRNKAKGKVLVNAILPSEVNSEWRDFVEKHSPKQQSDIFRELVLNYSSAVTVDELVKMDEEEANAKIVANAKKKKLKPIRK